MLRNRGVNVTERRIKHDVLRAYEYDILDARPKWRCLHEAGCQTNIYRQPRYCTVPRPVYYYTGKSSVTNLGVKRVYLPDEEWGTGSAESIVYFRNPRNNMGSYYPNEVYHINGERSYRRDYRYPEGYYSRRPSSMYVDDDDYYPRRSCSKYTSRRLVRTVTRKLSPIFPCDCTTKSDVKQKCNRNNDIQKHKTQNNLSEEAKKLSLDVYKILSLLQKADGEDEDMFSSVSSLQNIHNLECRSSNSVAKLITQRVNICQKMERRKQDQTLSNFKTTSGVRTKIEAIVRALKELQTEKALNDSSHSDNMPKYNDLIPSDPPSLEIQSFSNGKDLQSSTNVDYGGKRRNIVLQTDEPKTSNKSVCGKIKLKKRDSSAERKSLRSRLSWRKKETSGIKMRRDSGKERLSDKKTEYETSCFSKTKSKCRIRSRGHNILESEQQIAQPEKNDGIKGSPTNKAGLVIKFGGSPQRKKQPPPEKHKDKMPKTWIKRFLEDKRDSKNNNIRIRWNNKAFYTKSSSTVFELVNHVYKQMGINRNSKSDEITRSKNKKALKKTTHKQSKTRVHKTSKHGKYNQKVEAYMMPEIIVPGPVFKYANVTKDDNTKDVQFVSHLPYELSPLKEFTTSLYNGAENTSNLCSYNFEIQLPKTFFLPAVTNNLSSNNERVEETDEYIIIQSDSSEKTLVDDLSGMSVDNDKEFDFNDSISFKTNEEVHSKTVFQVSNSVCFSNKCQDVEESESQGEPELESNKLEVEIEKLADKEMHQNSPKSYCSLAKQFILDEYRNLMPVSADLLQWHADCDDLEKVSTIQYDDISILTDTDNTTITPIQDYANKKIRDKVGLDSKVYKRRKFQDSLNRWKDRATGTLSESIIGVNSRAPIVTVLWGLFSHFRKSFSVKTKIKPPPQHLSCVEPPGTVSEPKCSYKTQDLQLSQALQSQKSQPLFEPLKLAQLVSATLQFEQEEAKIKPQLTCNLITPVEIACLGDNTSGVEENVESEKLSNTTRTEETERTFMFRRTMGLDMDMIFAEAVQAKVPKKIKRKPDIMSSSPIRLVRSFHINIQTDGIEIRPARSVLFPLQEVYHFQLISNLIAAHYKHTRIEQTPKSIERLTTDQTQILHVPSRLDDLLQNAVDDNEVLANNAKYNLKDKSGKSREEFVLRKFPSNIVHPEFFSKPDQKCINLHDFDICNERKCLTTKPFDINTKTTKQFSYVAQMSKLKNNPLPSDTPHIELERETSQIRLEVTQGDKVTKIFFEKRNSAEVKKKKSIDLTFETPMNCNRGSIKQFAKRKSKKNIKVCINITNYNTKKAENNKHRNANLFHQQNRMKDTNKTQVVAGYTDFKQHPEKTAESTGGTKGCSVQESLSPRVFIESCPKRDDCDDMFGFNMQPAFFTKSTKKGSKNATELNNPIVIDKHNVAAEDYVSKISEAANEATQNSRLIEMKRMLDGLMMFKISAFAEMALKQELASEHNESYSSLRQQLKRRKEIVNILSEINMRHTGTDNLRDKATTTAKVIYDDKSESSGFCDCPLCSILETNLYRYPNVDVDVPIRFKTRTKRDITANYNVPHWEKPVLHHPLVFKELLGFLNDETVLNNSDTFINNDYSEMEAEINYLLQSSKQTGENTRRDKPLFLYCVKKEKPLKSNITNNKQMKKHSYGSVANTNQNHEILDDIDNFGTHKSYTEFQVLHENNDSPTKKANTLYNDVNKSDILQSYRMKKAVLQIYKEETAENEGYYYVADIPEYLCL